MKKFTIIIFFLVSVFLVFIYFRKKTDEIKPRNIQHSTIVTPLSSNIDTKTQGFSDIDNTQDNLFSSIPLNSDETLIHTYSINLTNSQNDSQTEDQICVIKRTQNPYLILLVGLYNPITASYSRETEISTEIVQFNTFSLSSADVTGDHKNALIFSGLSNTNKTVMQIYQPSTNQEEFILTKIFDISSDGTVFIQDKQRSEAYAMGLTAGESLNITEYCPDPNAGDNSLDQLEITYSWNKLLNTYTKLSQNRLTGKMINSKEFSRILDGTTETFSKFLTGLWYKTVSSDKEMRYIFFDPDAKEIICLLNDTQELYSWNTGWMRKSGISINTENKTMSAISRRFDITLAAIDEIKIKITDDVRMVIGEETLWDGNYKKLQTISSQNTNETTPFSSDDSFLQTKTQLWIDTDNRTLAFNGQEYIATTNESSESGVYTLNSLNGVLILECRAYSNTNFINGYYKVIFNNKKADDNPETLVLQPVELNVNQIIEFNDSIKFERK